MGSSTKDMNKMQLDWMLLQLSSRTRCFSEAKRYILISLPFLLYPHFNDTETSHTNTEEKENQEISGRANVHPQNTNGKMTQ